MTLTDRVEALTALAERVEGLPERFDPAGYERKPRFLGKPMKAVLSAFYDLLDERLRAMPDEELVTFMEACHKVSPVNCAWCEYDIAKLLYHDAELEWSERLSRIALAEAPLEGGR